MAKDDKKKKAKNNPIDSLSDKTSGIWKKERNADTMTKLEKGKKMPKSIAGMARKSLFEFPTFISSSVDYKYAEATCGLVELTYGSYLQQAISLAPSIGTTELEDDPFAKWKTDTNNYLECSNLTDTFDVCHNVITTEEGSVLEFELVSIPDNVAKIINECAEYEPLSEFDHYFQEAGTTSGTTSGSGSGSGSMGSSIAGTNPYTPPTGTAGTMPAGSNNTGNNTSNFGNPITQVYPGDRDPHLTDEDIKRFMDYANYGFKYNKEIRDQLRFNFEKLDRDAVLAIQRYNAAMDAYEADKKNNIKPDISKVEKLLPADLERALTDQWNRLHREENRRLEIDKIRSMTAPKAPELLDESKVQKLNSLKPLMMNVQLSVYEDRKSVPEADKFMQMTKNFVIGVKTFSRIIPAETLPEVAEYPLIEMNNQTRHVRYKAGELKLFRDIILKIPQKKQTAIDSKDPNRRWYRRLYELAHTTGDTASVNKLTKGKGILMSRLKDKLLNFGQTEEKVGRGFIPNATIIISKEDVDNVLAEKGIDLLKPSAAFSFCRELFLMNFAVIDMNAQTIKVLTPDLHKDFEIHTLASIEKQLASIDSSAAASREIFKVLKK